MLLLWSAWACPDVDAKLEEAETALADARDDLVPGLLEEVVQGLGCGPVATKAQLGRMWLVEGVNAMLIGDRETGIDAFAALHRVQPDLWVTGRYSEAIDAAYEAAERKGTGSLALTPELGLNRAFLNGDPSTDRMDVPAGLHALQVTPEQGDAVFATVVYVTAGRDLTVDTQVETVRPVVQVPEPVVEKEPFELKRTGWLAVAGVAVGASVGAALLASSQTRSMEKATTFGELDRAYSRQKLYTGVSVGLAGVGVGVTGVWAVGQF